MLIAALWRRLARLLRRGLFWRARLQRETVAGAQLVVPREPPPFLREYQHYCVALFRAALRREPRRLCLLFDTAEPPAATDLALRRVAFQWEHMLVLPGGRDSADAQPGAVAGADGQVYLVRVERLAALQAADIVIEYSRPNLEHLRRSGQFPALQRKLVPVAPLLHRVDFRRRGRRYGLLTLFADIHQSRRVNLMRRACAERVPMMNVRGIYDCAGLQRLYRRTRVLINVHQTDHHHTLEELRVLPALQSGVIVVSEDVPLREQVPYHAYIIWSSYDTLLQTAQAVLADFDRLHAQIFGDGRLRALLERMQRENRDNVEKALRCVDPPDADSRSAHGE